MKKNVSLVLSGGGARGIAHIGVIEELEKQGFVIKSIAGTSMGALVGGIYCLGKMEEFKEWLYSLDKLKVFKLVDFTLSAHGLIKGDRVFKTIREFIADEKIEDLKINFAATATDLTHNKEVVFTSGSIYDAIRASVAIPNVITPVTYGNSLLVDGGVLDNVPVDHVKRTKNDILVVVYVNADIPAPKSEMKPDRKEEEDPEYLKKIKEFQEWLFKSDDKIKKEKLGYFELMDKTYSLMRDQMANLAIEKHSPDILINISRHASGSFDFYRAAELVEAGRQSAGKALDNFRK